MLVSLALLDIFQLISLLGFNALGFTCGGEFLGSSWGVILCPVYVFTPVEFIFFYVNFGLGISPF